MIVDKCHIYMTKFVITAFFYCFIGTRRPARDVRGCILDVTGTENPGKLATVVKKKFNLF